LGTGYVYIDGAQCFKYYATSLANLDAIKIYFDRFPPRIPTKLASLNTLWQLVELKKKGHHLQSSPHRPQFLALADTLLDRSKKLLLSTKPTVAVEDIVPAP